MVNGSRFLSGKECAERLGILPDTWTSYRARGRTPTPDVWIGSTPGWMPETIDGWQRPGQGRKTKKERAMDTKTSVWNEATHAWEAVDVGPWDGYPLDRSDISAQDIGGPVGQPIRLALLDEDGDEISAVETASR